MGRLRAAFLALVLIVAACSSGSGGAIDEEAAEVGWSVRPSMAARAEAVWTVGLDDQHLSGSPAATADLVVLPVRGADDVTWLLALDRETGDERWRVEAPETAFFQTVRSVHGAVTATVSHYPGSGERNFERWVGFDPETGERLWDVVTDKETKYGAVGGRLLRRRLDPLGIDVLSALDLSVVSSVDLTGEGGLGGGRGRINVGPPGVIDLFHRNTYEHVVGPVEVGLTEGHALDAGGLLLVLDSAADLLRAFDVDGTELATLEIEGVGAFVNASRDRPAVAVETKHGLVIVEMIDGELVPTRELDPDGTFHRSDGATYLLRERKSGVDELVELATGDTTATAEVLTPQADGVLVPRGPGEPDYIAMNFDGSERWRLRVPSSEHLGLVEGGMLVVRTEPDAEHTVTFYD